MVLLIEKKKTHKKEVNILFILQRICKCGHKSTISFKQTLKSTDCRNGNGVDKIEMFDGESPSMNEVDLTQVATTSKSSKKKR